MQEKIIILDFGSQTTQLIGRRVRELNMSVSSCQEALSLFTMKAHLKLT